MDVIKRPARSTVSLRSVEQLQRTLLKLKALKDTVKDKRRLVSEAVQIIGRGDEPGDHADEVHHRLMHLIEMEIEEEWAKYLTRFREEQDQSNGHIAAAWPE
jgi:hypothetical protein